MSTVQVVLVCATVLALYAMRTRPWDVWYEDESVYDLVRDKATTVVTLVTSESIRGVVLRSTKTFIELGEARYLGSSAQVNMTGTIRIPRTNVLFVQDVTTAESVADTN